MFYGTRWFYKILYFLTSMSPAYILFLLQIDDKFKSHLNKEIEFGDFLIKLDIYWCCGLLLLFLILLGFLLRALIINQYIKASTDQVLPPKKEYFEENKLEERNGNVISFLLGTVIPAVLIIESDIKIAVAVFVVIQILIYILIMKSTDIFPNVLLIIFGISLCKTQHNDYVFTFKSDKYQDLKVYKIGDPEKSKIHITMYKK